MVLIDLSYVETHIVHAVGQPIESDVAFEHLLTSIGVNNEYAVSLVVRMGVGEQCVQWRYRWHGGERAFALPAQP